MGQFKDAGSPALALAEECAEVIQVINKLYRFSGKWDEIPVGKDKSRWQELCDEMEDVFYQWERLKWSREPKDEYTWGDCESPNSAG